MAEIVQRDSFAVILHGGAAIRGCAHLKCQISANQ